MSWRDDPPTPGQLALLDDWGITVSPSFTKGDASDLITQELAERRSNKSDEDYRDESNYEDLEDIRYDRD
jgi:hypothetical protein